MLLLQTLLAALALVGRMACVLKLPTRTVRGVDSITVTAFSPPATLVMVGASGLPDIKERKAGAVITYKKSGQP